MESMVNAPEGWRSGASNSRRKHGNAGNAGGFDAVPASGMIQRFGRSHFDRTRLSVTRCENDDANDEIECRCCESTRLARAHSLFDPLPEWCSPLTPGVQFVNLSHSEDGRNLRVDLCADRKRMFSQLSMAGEGLLMTRNEAAIVGRRMAYPDLAVTRGGRKGASGDGGIWVNFQHLGTAHAIHHRRDTGHVFGVEFADDSGQIVHRFTLTPASNMDEFFAWVRLHQACAAHIPEGFLERESEGEALQSNRSHLVRTCDSGGLLSVLAGCIDRKLPLRVTVRGTAVTQRVEFTPASLQPSDSWWFLSNDETGVHVHPESLPEVSVEEHVHPSDRNTISLRASLADGTTALVLEAGCSDAEDAWCDLLSAMA